MEQTTPTNLVTKIREHFRSEWIKRGGDDESFAHYWGRQGASEAAEVASEIATNQKQTTFNPYDSSDLEKSQFIQEHGMEAYADACYAAVERGEDR